jgi:hypothetical protein
VFASRYKNDDRRLATMTMFSLIRNSERAAAWQPITSKDAQPDGGTPLYDAVGLITSLMQQASDERAVLIVETDGEENMSVELTREGAKAALDRVRERGWQVVFLGADFDAFGQSRSLGVSAVNTLNMSGDKGRQNTYSETLVRATHAYGASGQSMAFSAEDRDAAKGQIKK